MTTIYLAVGLVAPSVLKSTSIRADHVISSFLFIPSYHPILSGQIWPLVIPGWSLNYEWFFYLVFALAIALAPHRRAVIAIGILISLTGLGLCVPSLNPIVRTYSSTLLIEFIFGIVVGEAFLANDTRAIPVALSLFLIIGAASVVAKQGGINIWQSAVYGSLSAALLSALLWLERRGARSKNPIAIALGDSSYSIYLTHVVIVAVLRQFSVRSSIQEFGGYLYIPLLFLVLCVCGVLGWVNFVLIERPMTAWLNRQLNIWRRLSNSASQIPKRY
jgi:exopolysaccharide production protein ExoZ